MGLWKPPVAGGGAPEFNLNKPLSATQFTELGYIKNQGDYVLQLSGILFAGVLPFYLFSVGQTADYIYASTMGFFNTTTFELYGSVSRYAPLTATEKFVDTVIGHLLSDGSIEGFSTMYHPTSTSWTAIMCIGYSSQSEWRGFRVYHTYNITTSNWTTNIWLGGGGSPQEGFCLTHRHRPSLNDRNCQLGIDIPQPEGYSIFLPFIFYDFELSEKILRLGNCSFDRTYIELTNNGIEFPDTSDTIVAKITADGEYESLKNGYGILLRDATTGTRYRLRVNNGAIELVAT